MRRLRYSSPIVRGSGDDSSKIRNATAAAICAVSRNADLALYDNSPAKDSKNLSLWLVRLARDVITAGLYDRYNPSTFPSCLCG